MNFALFAEQIMKLIRKINIAWNRGPNIFFIDDCRV